MSEKVVNLCPRNGADQRRLLFVEAYIANVYNATQAAIAAGLSEKSAYSQGHELLKHPEVAAAIAAGFSEKTAHVQGRDLLRIPKVAALVSARQQDAGLLQHPTQD